MSSNSQIPKLQDSNALGGRLAGGSPPSSYPGALPQRGKGAGVSSYQPASPSLDISPLVSGASEVTLSSASQMVDLSAGALRDILSSARAGDVQIFWSFGLSSGELFLRS